MSLRFARLRDELVLVDRPLRASNSRYGARTRASGGPRPTVSFAREICPRRARFSAERHVQRRKRRRARRSKRATVARARAGARAVGAPRAWVRYLNLAQTQRQLFSELARHRVPYPYNGSASHRRDQPLDRRRVARRQSAKSCRGWAAHAWAYVRRASSSHSHAQMMNVERRLIPRGRLALAAALRRRAFLASTWHRSSPPGQ